MSSSPSSVRLKRWLVGHQYTWGSALIVALAVGFAAVASWLLYQHTVDLLTERLRDRLVAIVRTAAVQFDARDLEQLQVADDHHKPEWPQVVGQLQAIRANNPDVIFAYILRHAADDPAKIVFVADADSLDPFAEIDLNQDGVIDEADALAAPGDEYEDAPADIFAGFHEPTANRELYEDQWGWLISGYAPIHDATGNAVAVVAVDIRANNFFTLTRQTFWPFLTFIVALLAIITVQALVLRQLWRKQVEQLAEIDRQKDELLSIVSHQLGGPITSLRWGLESFREGDLGTLTPEQNEEVCKMQLSAAGLADLVGLLLDLSRIELGRLAVDKQDVELRPFLEELLQGIEVLAREKGVALEADLPKKLPTVRLDRRLTRMTLENLLNNAVKYTPEQGRVTFIARVVDGKLHCRISDTGCGIPSADLPQLFTKLYRASNVRDTIPGNGFGLYIAKGAIEQQGGTIRCQSTVGQGTTFDVELPLQ